ncbi:DUF262 domain-containing protein [Arcticibacter tournemirensis]|uniref:DUF262 domain-containing protein n=1 Tax=Arcticibacter tournemirensis TaxID=699437 RepID=A0A4Q0MFA6_9SPHI|nr:DUF262 domain-containing protein [Arcticibacter tournemirensis]RXF71965.1 DUF262 domain-containing protein [Arcticibacter tournemirensis]
MRITELADLVSTGIKISSSQLSSKPSGFLYLKPENIERAIAISEADAMYIIEKVSKSVLSNSIDVGYGDYLIYSYKNDGDYSLLRVVQDFKKKIVPSNNFIIIKGPSSFLSTFLQHEMGRLYFLKEIQDIANRANGNFLDVIKQFKQIDIDPVVLEKVNLPSYISPGNSTINEEDLKKINVRGDVITIDNIYKRLKENEIRLDGYFQRKSNLWNDDIKSRLIETIILNMPIPPLFFDVTNDDRWLIVDGLQRISAINSFYNNELALTKLDYIPSLEGKYYRDLNRTYQRKFEEKQLSYSAIYPGTPKSVRYKIFKNINVSALILNRQEIRHAINEDEDLEFTSSKYILSLTEVINKYIIIPEKGTTGKERMADAELCLRYIAFRVLNYVHDYGGNIQDFLDKAMERINSYERNKLNVFKVDFEDALKTLTAIFSPDVIFTKAMVQVEGPKSFNGNLFGVWTYLFTRLNYEERQSLIERRNLFTKRALKMSDDPQYEKSIDSRYFETIESLKVNIETVEKFIKAFFND